MCSSRHRVGYTCACEDTDLTFISLTWGKKAETSIIAQMSARVVDSLYAQISNLLNSYHLKIIASEPNK